VVSITASNSASLRYASSPVLPNGAIACAPAATRRSIIAASDAVATPVSSNGVTG